MFGKIKEFIKGDSALQIDTAGTPSTHELQLATAVLLLEMAGADDDFAPEEVQTCFQIMESQFKISDMQSLELMEQAQSLREVEGKVDEFIEAVNTHFNEKQKTLILAMVWKVLLADDVIENFEQKFASSLRQKLGLSREAADQARVMAERGDI